MKLIPIIADVWKMDGGVAFGVVPKSIWQKIYPADENNMLDIVNRCLLIDFGEQRILIDAGMGRKQSNKYYQHRGVNPHVTLEKALAAAGYSHQDITDVLLTHLHDDHVGGVTVYNSSGKAEPLFPNATFWCSKTQWEWAIHPNKREGASYFPENLLPLLNSGRLKFIESEGEFLTGINIRMINGHTIGHILPLIGTRNGTIVYMGDFIATAANIPIPYIPAVDIQPLVSMDEKSRFLEEAIQKKYILFFEHDYFNECCTVIETPKGFSAGDKFRLAELTGISI